LEIAYEDTGPPDGQPVVLMHGFPYDVRAYDEVVPLLTSAGCRTVVPYLRGYGPTRFLDPVAPRSGEQAALGNDLLELITALDLQKPIIAGYDWGGRAACIVAALFPSRVLGLVTIGGYNLFGGEDPLMPSEVEWEHARWYQYYFLSERGRAGLTLRRREVCRYIWSIWSPTWSFDDHTFERSAQSFDNPDFAEIVIHSYRHRHGLVPGDPTLSDMRRKLLSQPEISVPTVVLYGTEGDLRRKRKLALDRFVGPCRYRDIVGVGHNLPQEAPAATAEAIHAILKGL
jgi:pimeloyl-ACP methyl ester carboxylesterase